MFLTVLGAQLWVVWLYGSPIPLWDQWDEAVFFKSWLAGNLKWTDFFAAHNEHRIFATRLLDVGVIWLNGRWDPLLQMTVNAGIHAAYACGLAYLLWNFCGRKRGWLACLLLAPFFALPYAGENAIWGFNSQDYFVSIFALGALAGLGFGKTGGGRWWLGVICALMGLFNMASGLLAPVAAGGVIVLRAMKNRRMEKPEMVSLAVCGVIVALGAALNVTKDADRTFQAHSFVEFTAALTRNLSWPFYNAPLAPGLIVLPLVVLLVMYLQPHFQYARAAEFLLSLALWSLLQSLVIAYGRANYGGTFPVSRYMDWFNVLVIAAVFAAVLLASMWERHRIRKGIAAFIFVALIFYGMCRISSIVVDGLLVRVRLINLESEESVERFMATGNEAAFLARPSVPPDPQLALGVLRDTQLQSILPVDCLQPGNAAKPGRFSGVAGFLLSHAVDLLCGGLFLFAGLCGYGLARGALGLSAKNPAGIVALLAVLASLGFVWSRHTVSRQSVEYALQEQIAANFRAAGNAERAAFHEQKAQELKQFAN